MNKSLLVIITLFFSVTAWSQKIVSQAVGTVAEQVMTSREVKMSIMVSKVLGDRRAQGFKEEEMIVGHPSFALAVTQVLLDQVFLNEGEGFSFSDLGESEVKRERVKLQSLSKNKFWLELEPSPEEVERILIRKLKSSAFFKFKAETLRGTVSDAEIRSYYEGNKDKFGAGKFETFKDNIRMFLIQQQSQERMRTWFELVKRKHKVRNFLTETL